jgi:hypothetical protein
VEKVVAARRLSALLFEAKHQICDALSGHYTHTQRSHTYRSIRAAAGRPIRSPAPPDSTQQTCERFPVVIHPSVLACTKYRTHAHLRPRRQLNIIDHEAILCLTA